MRKRAAKTNGAVRKKRVEEKPPVVKSPGSGGGLQYASSQIFHLLGDQRDSRPTRSLSTEVDMGPAPEVSGTGQSHQDTVMGTSVRLQGLTKADFDGGSYATENVKLRPGTECGACEGTQCVHVTGTLVARYHVTTTVTLPSVSDFPDLTECQKARVRTAIRNVLAPHEQQHVQAFRTYNGVTRTAFDLTLCRSDFDSTIKSMFDTEASARESAARSASAALDPFHFDVDLNCEDEPSSYIPEGPGISEEA